MSRYERSGNLWGFACLVGGWVVALALAFASKVHGVGAWVSLAGIGVFLFGFVGFFVLGFRSEIVVRRWMREGRCRHCGYPLRPIGSATSEDPDRCTECGANDARGPK